MPIPQIPESATNEGDTESFEGASNPNDKSVSIDGSRNENIDETSCSNESCEDLGPYLGAIDTIATQGVPFVLLERIDVGIAHDDTETDNNFSENDHFDTNCNNGKNDTVSVETVNINSAAETEAETNDNDSSALSSSFDSQMNAVSIGFNENAVDPLSQPVEVKPEPMHMVYYENFDQIIHYIEEPEEDVVDDELTFYVNSKGYAKPIDTLMDGRCKREKFDTFSGMVSFFNTVRWNSDKFYCYIY